MTLIRCTYGKGRVRVLRIHREADRQSVRELTVKVMLEGDFAGAFVRADNSTTVATDTIKNLVYIVAHENPAADTEPFCRLLATRFLDRYPQVERATVLAKETKWNRLDVDGAPHAHSFLLDNNGKPTATIVASRDSVTVSSGVEGFTFMKSTGSGWLNYVKDEYTTLPETRDRVCATSMDASWDWSSEPADYPAANAALLATMLKVFATTYSEGVQDSLYRMGMAGLAVVPEVARITMACPNKHYIPVNLAAFGLENGSAVLLPTDEPHGQIKCTVGRD
jgi:urate oxidase